MMFTMSDDKYVMCAGFDALTYCKFFSLCIRIMLVTSILSMCVILPINVTGDVEIDAGYNAETQKGGRTFTGFQSTTIANIKQRSLRLWAHTIVMVIVAIAAMWVRIRPCHSLRRRTTLHACAHMPVAATTACVLTSGCLRIFY